MEEYNNFRWINGNLLMKSLFQTKTDFFWTIFLWNRSLCFIRGCHKGFWTMESSHFIFWGIVCQKTHAGFGNVNCFGGCQVLHSFDFWLESFNQILKRFLKIFVNFQYFFSFLPTKWDKKWVLACQNLVCVLSEFS